MKLRLRIFKYCIMKLDDKILATRKNGYSIFKDFLRKSKFLFILTSIMAMCVAFTSCGGDDDEDFSDTGTNLSISDISGNWIATSASFNAPEYMDMLAEGGTVTLNIQSNGRFTFTSKAPGEIDEVVTGKVGFDGEWLAIRFDEDPDEEASFFISLVNNILTLRGQTEMDLDGNGVFDFGTLELIMKRA